MTITIYGIKACDTMKKSFVWLDQHKIDWQFHDYKKAGANDKDLQRWIKTFGWETVINRRGTSWKKLPEATRNSMDTAGAIKAALENPSLIKRPLIEGDGILEIGFDPAHWAEVFKR
ncbi:MAG: Spx/MgsR family RNA polymerase-binding regulatory protein [Alcanivoracaceae bacterium]|jgi:arsenate reductase|nr:Spx/MgsR family RNA polymerase-binding regulatory protein [Alcanivoracaceae bacterium]